MQGERLHWISAWKQFLEPLISDLASLLFTTHYLPQLQQQLSVHLIATGESC